MQGALREFDSDPAVLTVGTRVLHSDLQRRVQYAIHDAAACHAHASARVRTPSRVARQAMGGALTTRHDSYMLYFLRKACQYGGLVSMHHGMLPCRGIP